MKQTELIKNELPKLAINCAIGFEISYLFSANHHICRYWATCLYNPNNKEKIKALYKEAKNALIELKRTLAGDLRNQTKVQSWLDCLEAENKQILNPQRIDSTSWRAASVPLHPQSTSAQPQNSCKARCIKMNIYT